MDAPDGDSDIKLQKASAELILDLDRAITALCQTPNRRGRSFVRARETLESTTVILDLFQELPQLLDPHLARWIPMLAESYLVYARTSHLAACDARRASFLVPFDYAICRILYVFCKVRGEKVILRFLNVEARYLELLLSALEAAEERSRRAEGPAGWEWEQRYVVLLWLSHLLLAPFDLSTISSVELADDTDGPIISGLAWPDQLPGIAARLVPLAIQYLSSPGKDSAAAKAVLVRLALRRDMQKLGLLRNLVHWALIGLGPEEEEKKGTVPARSTYYYLGLLSFLAGLVRASAESSDMDEFLPAIFQTLFALFQGQGALSRALVPLAPVRRLILKTVRSVVVLLLRGALRQKVMATELTETAVGLVLDSLSDKETTVRLAASKALSIITLRLDPAMASEVVDAVLESLNRNVLWSKGMPATGDVASWVRDLSAVDHFEWHGLMLTLAHLLYRRSPPAGQLSNIVQSLLLGLSFEQRNTSGASVGANVRDAACFGAWALARRYGSEELLAVPTGSAAAREETSLTSSSSSVLQMLATELVVAACLDPVGNIRRGASAALQELVGRHPETIEEGIALVQAVDYHAVARRSRAVEEVGLRAAKLSTRYGEALADGIVGWRGIGDGDAGARRAAASAFGALTAVLTTAEGPAKLEATISAVRRRYDLLEKRQVEERHGLMMCLAHLLDTLPKLAQADDAEEKLQMDPRSAWARLTLEIVSGMLQDCASSAYRRPEMMAEGASKVVVASMPLMMAAVMRPAGQRRVDILEQTGREVLSQRRCRQFAEIVIDLDGQYQRQQQHEQGQRMDEQEQKPKQRPNKDRKAEELVREIVSVLETVMPAWLGRNEEDAIKPVSAAALTLLTLCGRQGRIKHLQEWADVVRKKAASGVGGTGNGYYRALSLAQPLASRRDGAPDGGAREMTVERGTDFVCEALLERWRTDDEVATRAAILQSLTETGTLAVKAQLFLGMLREGLNDYTTSSRGDVGSQVRTQALRAVHSLWKGTGQAAQQQQQQGEREKEEEEEEEEDGVEDEVDKEEEDEQVDGGDGDGRGGPSARILLDSVLRLAAEKLDKVRGEAQKVVCEALLNRDGKRMRCLSSSSKDYFAMLLEIGWSNHLLGRRWRCGLRSETGAREEGGTVGRMRELMAGLVSSTDGGNDELAVASRAALGDFCEASTAKREAIWAALLQNAGSDKDRLVVGTLETMAFCLRMGLGPAGGYGDVCGLTRQAGQRTGNMRKILACVRVYGAVAGRGGTADEGEEGEGEAGEARRRLGALLLHPWPRVRSAVVDELWGVTSATGEGDAAGERLMGVDWAKADKDMIQRLRQQLSLA